MTKLSLRDTSPEVRIAAVAGLCLLWVYLPTLAELAGRWVNEAQYGHGMLVPVFAAYLVWTRRDMLARATGPSFWGLALLGVGLGLCFLGQYIFFDWLTAASLLPCLAGLVVLTGGWRALGCFWPAIAFLIFMIPLPHSVAVGLAYPLQRVGTLASNFTLQLLGFVSFAEGNVIRLGDVTIGVVEACSGLSMLLMFFALSTAVVLIAPRTPLERGIVFLSAIPIALATNVIRIVVTAILHKTAGRELADLVFHDLAGYLMPLIALGMLWVEFRLLSWMLVPVVREEQGFVQLGGLAPTAKPKAAREGPGNAALALATAGPSSLERTAVR